MRVLHIGPIKMGRPSGAPGAICGLAAAQAEMGLEVGLLSSLPIPPGVEMEEIQGAYLLGGIRRRHYNPWFVPKDWIVQIRREFGEPDIVCCHGVYSPFISAIARRCRQVDWPYTFTAHGGLTRFAQSVKRTKKRISNILWFCDFLEHAIAVRALCAKEAEQIRDLFEVKKIITVPNGVENYLLETEGKLLPADLGDFRSEGDLVLGFIGRIDMYHKGLDLLLKAMAILNSQPSGTRCKLFVIGPFHRKKDKPRFTLAVEALGLKDSVKLVGPKYGEEKLRYFLTCDVFVHTSRWEGMPMAVLEAMALGRPCLVTPGTNMADVVREGGGWECEPNPESIVEAITSIYEKKDCLEELGEQSHRLIQSRFTWRKVAEQLREKYFDILADLS